MSAIDTFIRFVLYYEAGLRKSDMTGDFTDIFCKAKARGYAVDPDDRGGATMCGVTLASYRSYTGNPHATAAMLRDITPGQWREILRRLYWDRWQADKLPVQLAWLLVDWVWASGAWGIKTPQRILGVQADGVVGPLTLAAVGMWDAHTLFDTLHRERVDFVRRIADRDTTQRKFLRGWQRRINAITWEGLRYE